MSNTEGNSVAVVKLAIGTATDRLKPLIDENDRTPITDGHIDLYAEVTDSKKKLSQQSNDAWRERVAVQVRGRVDQTLKKGAQPFPLDRKTLENYRALGGVLFFHVVWANGKHEIRYCPLVPFKIDKLIARHTGGRKIKVPTQVFPEDADGMINVVKYAANGQAQTHAIDYNSEAFGEIRAFEFASDRPLDLSMPLPFDALDQNISIYITTERGVRLPANLGGTLTPISYMGESWDIVVKSGDVVFDHPIRRQVDPKTIAIHLSEGLHFTLSPKGELDELPIEGDSRQPPPSPDGDCGREETTPSGAGEVIAGVFTLGSQTNLVARLKDLEFVRAVAETGGFTLGGQFVELDRASELEPATRKEFGTLIRLQDTLAALGARASLIEMDKVTSAELRAFDYLHRVLFEDEPLIDPFRQMGRVRQRIGGWALELMVVPGSGGRDWDVMGLKKAGEKFAFASGVGEDDEKALVTPYELLDREAAERSINLELGSIREAYDKLAPFDYATELVINAALKLLGAADTVPERREELLGAAESLVDWALEKDEAHPVGLVNRMQIKARRAPLADADRTLLRKLRSEAADEDGVDALALRACCSVLLGEVEECNYLVDLMSAKQRENFQSWPIFSLLPRIDEVNQPTSPPVQ